MAFEFTFTARFQKNFKKLTEQEKKQLKKKLILLAENPSRPSLRTKAFREPPIFLNAVLTWTFGLSGTMKVTK